MYSYIFNKRNTDRFLVFLVILLSSRASTIANSETTIFVALLLNLLVMAKRHVKFDKPFALIIPVFALLVFQNWYQNDGEINWLRYVKLFSMITVGYCTIKLVQFEFFRFYNQFIYGIILFSLPFYCWQVISVESLHSFGTALSNIFPSLVETLPSSQNILFHTIEFVDRYRNSGPMWEPGGFATIIVLAMYFEFLSNNFKITKVVIVLLLGILITFSTTGYLLTFILGFVFLINSIKHKSAKVKLSFYLTIIPAFIAASVFVFFSSDIMYNKIQFLLADQLSKVEDMQHVQDLDLDAKFSLGRFGSFIVDIQSIKDNLIFGRGYDDDNFRHGSFDSFNLTNGLSNYTARLGIVGLIWLLFSLKKSGKLIEIALSGENRNNNILIIIVPLIAFSNPVLFTPLYLMLSFLFVPFKILKNNTSAV